jgi:hypothetical protein
MIGPGGSDVVGAFGTGAAAGEVVEADATYLVVLPSMEPGRDVLVVSDPSRSARS